MSLFTPEQVAHLAGRAVRADLLTRFDFRSETVRVWNGNTPLVTGGYTWLPLRGAGAIDGIGLAMAGQQSEAVTFTASGLPGQETDILALALAEAPEAEQQLVTISMQLFDEDWQPEGSPIAIWWGFMQAPRVTRTAATETEGATQTVTLTAENAFFNRARPPYGRYTDRDQQARSPGDRFFQFTGSLLFATFTYPDY